MEILTSVRRLYISFKSLVNDFVYSFGPAALLLLVEVQNHTVPIRERRRIRVIQLHAIMQEAELALHSSSHSFNTYVKLQYKNVHCQPFQQHVSLWSRMTVFSTDEANESPEYSFERYRHFSSTKFAICGGFGARNCYLLRKRGTILMNKLDCCEPLRGP